MGNTHRKALKSALAWYVDHGVDEVLADEVQDRTKMPVIASLAAPISAPNTVPNVLPNQGRAPAPLIMAAASAPPAPSMLGKADARAEAVKLAVAATTLEDLKEGIAKFEGLAIKKTATNLVFCDGNPEARVMLIGEAPGGDEDRQGKPFMGEVGDLLDRILKCIDLERGAEDPESGVYISNILNWRPPGNRSPSPAEIAVSLPFIEKHIILAKPKILILCGGVAAKALLGSADSISRLRKCGHEYRPQTAELGYDGPPIPAIATYHPASLLHTPAQKKAVWHDILALQKKRNDSNHN